MNNWIFYHLNILLGMKILIGIEIRLKWQPLVSVSIS